MKIQSLNRIIFILSIFGICIASYVLYSYVTGSPIVCVNQGCDLVRKSQYANVLGLPVPLYGLLGYTIISILSFLFTTNVSWKSKIPLTRFVISFGGFLFVSYLTYLEAFVIKGWCMWCVFSAIIMTTVFILSGISLLKFSGKK
jgi:uncharacterized membrane protein